MLARYIKMSWDCKYCNTKGISGDKKFCPGCGNPCGENVKFYVPKNKEYVDESVVPKGPDWQCNYCGSYNRSDETVCNNCGGERKGTKDYFGRNTESDKDDDVSKVTESYSYSDNNSRFTNESTGVTFGSNVMDENVNNETERRTQNILQKWASVAAVKYIALFVVLLGITGGLIYLFVPKERTLTVEGVSWERSATIYRYETVNESDWYLPSEARLRYTRNEIRRYDTVQDGYKTETYTVEELDHYDRHVSYVDKGNGYAEEVVEEVPVYKTVTKTREVPKYKEVPVYDTKYYYEIDKYVYNRVERVQNADKSPYWPENLPVEQKHPIIGDERVERRAEKYMIMARLTNKDGQLQEYTLNYNEWVDVNVGDTLKCKVYISGKIDILENM